MKNIKVVMLIKHNMSKIFNDLKVLTLFIQYMFFGRKGCSSVESFLQVLQESLMLLSFRAGKTARRRQVLLKSADFLLLLLFLCGISRGTQTEVKVTTTVNTFPVASTHFT